MGYKPRKGSSNGRSKLHAVRQHRSSKNHAGLSFCIHRRVGGEGARKVRDYIMKALNFGVESGYLIPTDQSFKMLRVSSDLFGKQRRRTASNTRYSGKVYESSRRSREIEKDDEPDDDIQSATRYEDYPEQDARRKRRKSRRRSQSRTRRKRRSSRKRSRRRRSSENPEEAGEDDDDDDYELNDNTAKKNARTEHTSNDSKSTRSKTQVSGKTNAEGTDDISDISIDEDDSDEDDDKKKDNTTKS